MSTSNIPIKSPFGVREAEENNRKEERLRDYPIEVEGDSVFYTVEFHYDTEDRGKDSVFVRGMTSHFCDTKSLKNHELFVRPRHCSLEFMSHRSEMKDADTSWDVWRVQMVNKTRIQEFIGTLIGIQLNRNSEFKYPNGRGRWTPLNPNWKGVPVISRQSVLYEDAMKLVSTADRNFPGKGQPDAYGRSVSNMQEKNNPFILNRQVSSTSSPIRINDDVNSGSNSGDSSEDSSDSDSTDDSSEEETVGTQEQQKTGKNYGSNNSSSNNSSNGDSNKGRGRHKRSHNGADREGEIPNSPENRPQRTGKEGRRSNKNKPKEGKSFKKYVKDETGAFVKRVEDTHGFLTLDNIYVTGRSKEDGEKNVVKTQGILRVVSFSRRSEIMYNLVFLDTKVFRSIMQAASEHAQHKQTPGFGDLGELAQLTDNPLFASEERIAEFYHMRWMISGDPSGWNLRYHTAPGEDSSWELKATSSGKRSLLAAIRRLELTFVMLFDEAFRRTLTAFDEIVNLCHTDTYDAIIRVTFEKCLGHWAEDVVSRRHPTAEGCEKLTMGSPQSCATLLETYAISAMHQIDSISENRSRDKENCPYPLERFPHTGWIRKTWGLFSKRDYDPAKIESHLVKKPGTIKKATDASQTKKVVATEKKSETELRIKSLDGGKEGSGHCPWHILGVLGVKGTHGLLSCTVKECDLNHTVTEVWGAGNAISEKGIDNMVIAPRLKDKMKSILKEEITGWA